MCQCQRVDHTSNICLSNLAVSLIMWSENLGINHIIAGNKCHDDVIKWKHFPRYWSFVRGIHRWPVNSQHKGQWRGALMFSLICAWINGWANNREAGDMRRHRAHYDVTVMFGQYLHPAHMYHRLRPSVTGKSGINKRANFSIRFVLIKNS